MAMRVGLLNREMWTCPECGRRFANRNQWHACGPYSVESFLEGKSPEAIRLLNSFVELAKSCGPVTLAPAKTRIGFQARMIFAAVNRLSDRKLAAHVVLARRLASPRFTRIESLTPTSHVHHFQISRLEELDDEVRAWLCEAYSVGTNQASGEQGAAVLR
jgi:hypothetical protein